MVMATRIGQEPWRLTTISGVCVAALAIDAGQQGLDFSQLSLEGLWNARAWRAGRSWPETAESMRLLDLCCSFPCMHRRRTLLGAGHQPCRVSS